MISRVLQATLVYVVVVAAAAVVIDVNHIIHVVCFATLYLRCDIVYGAVVVCRVVVLLFVTACGDDAVAWAP